MDNIFVKIKDILSKEFKFSKEDLEKVNENTLINDLGLDSLSKIELIMFLEEKFKITLEKELKEVKQIKDFVLLIEKGI